MYGKKASFLQHFSLAALFSIFANKLSDRKRHKQQKNNVYTQYLPSHLRHWCNDLFIYTPNSADLSHNFDQTCSIIGLKLFKYSTQRVLYLHTSENLVKIITLEKWFDGIFFPFEHHSFPRWIFGPWEKNFFFSRPFTRQFKDKLLWGKMVKIIKDILDVAHWYLHIEFRSIWKVGLCGSFSTIEQCIKVEPTQFKSFACPLPRSLSLALFWHT